MSFIERKPGEALAMHLHRNAEVIGADREQRARLRRAAALSLGDRDQRIEAGLIAQAIRRELGAALDMVIYAAQARGETAVEFNDDGAVRIKSRDGLQSMIDSKGLTEQRGNTGFAYRALFEMVGHASIGSQLNRAGEISVRSANTDAVVRHGLRRAYAGVQLTAADRAVQADDPTGRGLAVLRAVAGEGATIASLGKGGNVRAANLAALARALDVVRLSFADTGGLRIRGS